VNIERWRSSRSVGSGGKIIRVSIVTASWRRHQKGGSSPYDEAAWHGWQHGKATDDVKRQRKAGVTWWRVKPALLFAPALCSTTSHNRSNTHHNASSSSHHSTLLAATL